MFLVYSLYNYQLLLRRCLYKSPKVFYNVIGAVDQGWLLRLCGNKNMPTNDGQYMYYKKNTHAPTVTVFTFAAHLTVHRCAQQYRPTVVSCVFGQQLKPF